MLVSTLVFSRSDLDESDRIYCREKVFAATHIQRISLIYLKRIE